MVAPTSADFAEVTTSTVEIVASMAAATASTEAVTASIEAATASTLEAGNIMAQVVGITGTAEIGAGITVATVTGPETITGITAGATITTATPTIGGRGTTGIMTGTLTLTTRMCITMTRTMDTIAAAIARIMAGPFTQADIPKRGGPTIGNDPFLPHLIVSKVL